MDTLKVLRITITFTLFVVFIYELTMIAIKAIARESFQAINELKFERLPAPLITLCPGTAWKSAGPFLSKEEFPKNTYKWEDLFHPKTLEVLRNETLFKVKETYASYYGLCYTVRKLNPEKVSDYSFQIVVNDTLGNVFCSEIIRYDAL